MAARFSGSVTASRCTALTGVRLWSLPDQARAGSSQLSSTSAASERHALNLSLVVSEAASAVAGPVYSRQASGLPLGLSSGCRWL
eukprot:112216-Rhodomonas_salina.1